MKVAVVMGGASPEHQVSLASGRGIAKAVSLLGHTAIPLVIDAEGDWVDGQHEAIEILQACDVTVPALHGEGGEDGTLQGFLRQLKSPVRRQRRGSQCGRAGQAPHKGRTEGAWHRGHAGCHACRFRPHRHRGRDAEAQDGRSRLSRSS